MEAHNIRIVAHRGERGILAYSGWCDLCENGPQPILEFSNGDEEQPGLALCLTCLREALAKAGWLAKLR